MFVAVRYMQGEINAIAELVGPFNTYEESIAYMDSNWGELNSDECESYQLTTPVALAVIVPEESDNEAPF